MARSRHLFINLFVICWIILFQYETFRAHYFGPLFKRELPKFPLLYPPAGWIMFYQIDNSYGFAETYGIRGQTPIKLDPHRIFETKGIGYDNIRRNVLIEILYPSERPAFCRYLRRKFPDFDSFAIAYGQCPDIIRAPKNVMRQVVYQCR